MKFKSIHHVAIIASDIDKSKDFYSKILGFEISKETYRKERDSFKIDLKINDQSQIELFSFPNSPKRVSYPEALGLRHLAFEVENLDQAVNHLKENNIEVEEVRLDEITGKRFTFFKDPDNLPLEVYEVER